ncbi:MAG: tetraacyldisaccharide 4'-kinase [Planctomycetota bacterium]|jgi:tetraacyldisaccharide 4'-kinase
MQALPHLFRNIIEERFSVPALFLKVLLMPLSLLYSLLILLRLQLYQIGILKKFKAGCPVISIGNLTVGGTGKTPFTIFLAEYLRKKGLNPAIVSRGYKPGSSGENDEESLVKQRLTGIIYKSSPVRKEACLAALDSGADIIILDDGFQHLSMERDLDIVLIDSNNPYGGHFVLPSGMLREPYGALSRADIAVFTKCRQNNNSARLDKIKNSYPELKYFKSSMTDIKIKDTDGNEAAPAEPAEKSALLVSSIARPDSFRKTAEDSGFNVTGVLAFSDHHNYTQKDIHTIIENAQSSSSGCILTTEKDIVKLAKLFPVERNFIKLYYLEISIMINADEDMFFQTIDKVTHLAKS